MVKQDRRVLVGLGIDQERQLPVRVSLKGSIEKGAVGGGEGGKENMEGLFPDGIFQALG